MKKTIAIFALFLAAFTGQCLLRVKRHAGECLSDLASGLSFSAGGYHYDSGLYPENEKNEHPHVKAWHHHGHCPVF